MCGGGVILILILILNGDPPLSPPPTKGTRDLKGVGIKSFTYIVITQQIAEAMRSGGGTKGW